MTQSSEELVEYIRDDQVVTLRLNRPQKLNAFNDAMVIALRDALRKFDADPDANIAIICGNGRAFSTGADVHERQLRSREEFERLGGPQGFGANAGDLLVNSVNWKPVITAPHGYVLGLSTGIVLESDLIVAEAGTQFQITETSRGLGGAKYWGLMNFRGAGAFGNEVALTGRFFTAEEAHHHGVIDRVAPTGTYLEAAHALAEEVCKNPPLSVRATVRTRRWYMDRQSREINMQNAPQKLYLTEDFKEAATAFAEKRPPNRFKGK
ncbi:MAG: enoyl-CoA hydratase/isomerase family protein [Gammaproteobacteria bacterium]|nr:enoyl-CoA hydratase/isomerase family protein [Gammaproteobacteria bacterium]